MKFRILNQLSVLFIIEICHRSFAKLSIPTRDFSLRVPQAKPSQPETYVSLMCNYQKFSEKYVKQIISLDILPRLRVFTVLYRFARHCVLIKVTLTTLLVSSHWRKNILLITCFYMVSGFI